MTFQLPLRYRVGRILAFLCLLAALAGVSTGFAAGIKFSIPAEAAPDALNLFIKQSGCVVLYPYDELKGVTTKAVQGEFEPAEALKLLLDGSGYSAATQGAGKFLVRRDDPVTTGSVRGSLTWENGAPAPGVLVVVKETMQSVSTDSRGQYLFPALPPGSYTLIVSLTGYQPLHITDVNVGANRELTLSEESLRKANDVAEMEPYEVKAKTITELEKYEVTDTRPRPFAGANVDLPRTIDDAQPYYIFDSKTIDQSGATNVEEFLKARLTMNATMQTNGETSGLNVSGNASSINLRGLGANETLILVDGRRWAGVNIEDASSQPDLNGIPLSAIERIEVLPSSASGIYGGSAIGGVINVILKKNYVGGEIRATYDNTWNTDAPIRTLAASYGMALEGGKTHFMVNAQWSDAQSLLLQDRREIFDQNLATILNNSPTYIYSKTTPFLGALPNILPTSSAQGTLTLRNGVVIPSRDTYVPAGTSSTTSAADLDASLLANAGLWNLDLPATSAQSPTGLLRPFGAAPQTRSFNASLNRQMLANLELYAEFGVNENRTTSIYDPFPDSLTVPASSPVNPFTTAVRVQTPDVSQVPLDTQSVARNFTLGAIAQLPRDWKAEVDYSWSESHFAYQRSFYDSAAMRSDLASGLLDPFVDTLRYPLNFGRYLYPLTSEGSSTLNDFAVRGSGPLAALPWGVPNLTIGLERRTARTPNNVYQETDPITPANSYSVIYYPRSQVTDSGYGELTLPLLRKDWLPLAHLLELQVAGRVEHYTVDSGTIYDAVYPLDPSSDSYGGPTLNGQPYFAKSSYSSSNGTVGLKYQPVPALSFRASLATAFLPPTPEQLVQNPEVDPYTTTVIDPKTGNPVDVQTISGGNPNLKPQSSKSFNVGVIWEPQGNLLKGLRLDAEYYRTDQHNYIGSLDAQTIVNLESTYPGRVIRDATGTITTVDTSQINLFKLETEGWDLNARYTTRTSIGDFSFEVAESIILHLKNQYDLSLPETDAVNFPAEGGAAKYKSNATLTWERQGWTVSWTTTYFGSYKQFGAAGGPISSQDFGGAADTYYIQAQGSDTIPAQLYHDIFVGYAFGGVHPEGPGRLAHFGAGLVDGLTIQVGVRNVFNKVPPFDAYQTGNYYMSPYGDPRLRTYWVSVKKAF